MNKCNNYELCSNMTDTTDLCEKCSVYYGKLTFTNLLDECYICTNTKKMLKLCCDKHFVCMECWDQLCKSYWASYKPAEKRGPPKCPFCRQAIW